jgi:hypothetical protein
VTSAPAIHTQIPVNPASSASGAAKQPFRGMVLPGLGAALGWIFVFSFESTH